MQAVHARAAAAPSALGCLAALAIALPLGAVASRPGAAPYAAAAAGAAALGLALLLWRRGRERSSPPFGRAVALFLVSTHCAAFDAGPLNPPNAMITAFFAMWLWRRLLHPWGEWRSTVFAHLVFLYGCAALASLLGGFTEGFAGLLNLLPKLAGALLLLDLLETPTQVRSALWALIWSSAAAAGVGCVQALAWYGWDVDWTLQDNKEFPYLYSSLLRQLLLRISGFARNPHSFAEPMMLSALLCAYLLLVGAWRERRAALRLCLALCSTGLILSMARGQWIGFAAGLCALPFIARPRLTPLWLVAPLPLLALGIASGALQGLLQPLGELLAGGSGSVRFELLRVGLAVMAAHPWNGVGIGGFEEYAPPPDRYSVHNTLLQSGSELGVPGLVLATAAFGWVVLRLVRAIRSASEPAQRAEFGALLAGQIAMIVEAQSAPNAYSALTWVYFALAEAAVRADERRRAARAP